MMDDASSESQQQRAPMPDTAPTIRMPPPAPPAPLDVPWDDVPPPDASRPASVTVRSVVRELLETAIYILLVFVIVRSMVQNFKIEGSSMEPTLHNGQYILVNKLVYFNFDLNAPLRLLPGNGDLPPRMVYPLALPERGDIVVFEFPNDIRQDYIKRVIGLPGETVVIRDGHVFINGVELDEPYLEGAMTSCAPSSGCGAGTPVVVPEGSLFVIGDNRANSSDSRDWDSLSLDHVIGKAWILYYPMTDIGPIPHPTYAADIPPP